MSVHMNPYSPPRAARQTITFRAGDEFLRVCFGCGKPDVEPRQVTFARGRRSVRAAIPLCDRCLRRWESIGRRRAFLVLFACVMLAAAIYTAYEAPPGSSLGPIFVWFGFAAALSISVNWLIYFPPWRMRVLDIVGDDVTLAGVHTTAAPVPLRDVLFSRLMTWPLWLRRLGCLAVPVALVGSAMALWYWLAQAEPPPGPAPHGTESHATGED